MTQTCIHVSFDFDCPPAQYAELCQSAASAIAAVEGIHSKLWWVDAQARRAGGVYVFANRQAARRYLEGPIVAALREQPFVKQLETRLSDVQSELSAQTGYEFAGSASPTPGEPEHSDHGALGNGALGNGALSEAQRIEQFAGHVMRDLSAAFSGALVNLGHKLGLYRELAAGGPTTSAALAQRTGTHERYVREWLRHQRACGYIGHDRQTDQYRLTPEAVVVLAAADGPAFLPPAFDVAASIWASEDQLLDAFRSGRGIGWHEHDRRLFCGTESFFRGSYRAFLASAWIPALDGVQQKLERGARVADVGCGHGASTLVMAQAFPASRFVGFDSHAQSIAVARQRAADAGLSERVCFECASATQYAGGAYDLICFMDAFHDMGDPVGAARHAARSLGDAGTVMLVEPKAAARSEDNVGPIAALYYAASTALCTPNALCHAGGRALGAQAGPTELADALRQGGLGSFRVAAETPFNLVLEARP